jgi:hypothetical protein
MLAVDSDRADRVGQPIAEIVHADQIVTLVRPSTGSRSSGGDAAGSVADVEAEHVGRSPFGDRHRPVGGLPAARVAPSGHRAETERAIRIQLHVRGPSWVVLSAPDGQPIPGDGDRVAHASVAAADRAFFGPVNVTRAALPVMRAQRSGLLVTISSTAGLEGGEFTSAYAASKVGVEGWTESLAPEVAGIFSSPIDGDRKLPTVASRDIAAAAARLLLDDSWSRVEEVPLLGSEDLSFNDMAEIISDILGKQICFQQTTFEAYRDRFVSFGMSDAMAQGMTDMAWAKNEGLDNAVQRTAENSTPTSFRKWCEQVLKPAVLNQTETAVS